MKCVTKRQKIENLEHLIKALRIEIEYYRAQRDRWREIASQRKHCV